MNAIELLSLCLSLFSFFFLLLPSLSSGVAVLCHRTSSMLPRAITVIPIPSLFSPMNLTTHGPFSLLFSRFFLFLSTPLSSSDADLSHLHHRCRCRTKIRISSIFHLINSSLVFHGFICAPLPSAPFSSSTPSFTDAATVGFHGQPREWPPPSRFRSPSPSTSSTSTTIAEILSPPAGIHSAAASLLPPPTVRVQAALPLLLPASVAVSRHCQHRRRRSPPPLPAPR